MNSVPFYPNNSQNPHILGSNDTQIRKNKYASKNSSKQFEDSSQNLKSSPNLFFKNTAHTTSKQIPKSNALFPPQINIPYFNISLDSKEILDIVKTIFIKTLLEKFSDPQFLINILNSEGGHKLLKLANPFLNPTTSKTENGTNKSKE